MLGFTYKQLVVFFAFLGLLIAILTQGKLIPVELGFPICMIMFIILLVIVVEILYDKFKK